MATQHLACWAVSLKPSSLPSSVQHSALRSLYNYIGCAIGGSNHPTVLKAHSALSPFFGSPTSTLLGSPSTGPHLDAPHAALLNGISSHVHDYDDTHLATIIHPTGPVASAALAYAEYHHAPISGAELLTAITAGIEASCKLGLAVWPEHYDIGWHITSTTGAIGAAVTVGKLANLDGQQMAHAIGIASVSVIGLREMFGSDTKSFHPGSAAAAGLRAAMLAEKGFTSSGKALEAQRGWVNVVAGGGSPKLDKFLGELGRTWEIERNAFKPFPCGIVKHPVIDASIQLSEKMEECGLRARDVNEVLISVNPLVIELTAKRAPKDGLEAKFSVFHGCAVGLLYGKAGPAQYADKAVRDSEVISVRDKVEVDKNVALKADEAVVRLTFNNKQILEKEVAHAVGSLEVPLTDRQLEDKFVDQTSLIIGEKALQASKACWAIADSEDAAAVLKTLGSV